MADERVFVATARALYAVMRERIARHQADGYKSWRAVEASTARQRPGASMRELAASFPSIV